MNDAYLLIGGNIDDRVSYIEQAKGLIEKEAGSIIGSSFIYETAAWGVEDQEAFLNQVILIKTRLNPDELLRTLLAIEKALGRKRIIKYGPRTIDLDILLFNNAIVNKENLIIPHPSLPDRRFALIPLHQIAPAVLHPVLNKTITQLLQNCNDNLPVTIYSYNK